MVRRVASFTNRWAVFLWVAALGCAAPVSAAPADPALPATLVPEGATPYLRTHAVGTQNYVCVATGSGLAWRFAGPQATLFVTVLGFQQQVTTHFLSPNPEEAGIARATWQGSFDSSRVWARATQIVDDPAIIGAGNIPVAAAAARRGEPRPDRRLAALADHLDPADQHRGRRRAGHGLHRIHSTQERSRSCPTAPTMSSFADLRRSADAAGAVTRPALTAAVVRIGGVEIDMRRHEIRRGGETIRLQQQPFQILALLMEHAGGVVTRQDIERRLWPDGTTVDFEHSVNAAIRRLRVALGDDALEPRFVETVPRRGYRFVGRLDASGRVDERRPVAVRAATGPGAAVPDARRDAGRRPRLRR